VAYGVSANTRGGWVSLAEARALGYEPHDDAEDLAAEVIAEHGEPDPADPVFAHLGGEFCLPADAIKGGLCASGMYELAPVRLSARANYVKFTDEMVERLSPIRHLDRFRAPVIVSYATYETPEFQRQAREFAAALQAAGEPVELIVGDNYSHTELLETLCNPYGHLGAAILAQMGLPVADHL